MREIVNSDVTWGDGSARYTMSCIYRDYVEVRLYSALFVIRLGVIHKIA